MPESARLAIAPFCCKRLRCGGSGFPGGRCVFSIMDLRLVQYGEPVLRQRGERVERFDAGLAELADEMVALMHAEEGIGLAAQQVGRPLRMCVVDLRPADGGRPDFSHHYDGKPVPLDLIMPLVLANPEVSVMDDRETVYEEGCLSFPGVRGRVPRPAGVLCRFQDRAGGRHVLEADGLLARCILHEVDHVEGRLFIDRMDPKDLKKMEARIKRIKRASRDFLKT